MIIHIVTYKHVVTRFILLSILLITISCSTEQKFEFNNDDRIVYVGNALADRMNHEGWLETYLQASLPNRKLIFRNLAVSGDRIDYRPRSCGGRADQPEDEFECSDHQFWHPDSLMAVVEPTVIFSFFGYNESFDDDPAKFRNQLIEWINQKHSLEFNGQTPRIVLFSPIAHENPGTHNLPDGTENNRRLEDYTEVMQEVSREYNISFVNLFHATSELYSQSEIPLTINGVHLNSEGNREVASIIAQKLLGSITDMDKQKLQSINDAVLDKNWHWFNRYRPASGNDIWGSRKDWHDNYKPLQHELFMLDVMTENRDLVIWNWAKLEGEEIEGRETAGVIAADDSNVPDPLVVEEEMVSPYSSEFRPGDAAPGEEVEYLGGEEAIDQMVLAEGLSVNLFASEEMFPELINALQMQVDSRGRIWVSAWATYPKWEPLREMNDAILILEDTDGDGVADKSTTFANIHNPTGFEFWNGGIIVASTPNLWYLKDTTGDDKADVKIQLLGTFDNGMDTHHTANNFIYGPDGYIYYGRGIFHLSNVETPWAAPVESGIPAIFRFNPRTHHFEEFVEISPNPHGNSFDKWGRQFITDGTSGRAYQVYLNEEGEYDKRRLLDQTVRPVTGNYVLSSEHLPDSFENNFLISNVISFRGYKRYSLNEQNNGLIIGEELSDLLYSRDPNFRPTHAVIGSDGAIYISDWHNRHIAHSIPNMRSKLRDQSRGRIYRITADDRPLQEPVSIHGEPIEHLLDLLQHPVNSIRHRVRVELSGRDTDEVISKVMEWVQQFDPASVEDAHPLLEALWVHQQHNIVNQELLSYVLTSPDKRAREAARRVRYDWNINKPGSKSLINEDLGHEILNEVHETTENDHGMELDLSDDEIAELTIKTIPHQLLFDVTEFTVRSGQQVRLNFVNPDYMPHNILIVQPGTADEVAEEAIQLDAEGFEKKFIPDNPNVMYASDLLNVDEEELMEFIAPDKPGNYEFVCTFPGHATTMRGIMRVI